MTYQLNLLCEQTNWNDIYNVDRQRIYLYFHVTCMVSLYCLRELSVSGNKGNDAYSTRLHCKIPYKLVLLFITQNLI